jgi:hypothetical protein
MHGKNCELFKDIKILERWLKVCKLMNEPEHFCAYCLKWVETDKLKEREK